ncbi:MAG: hypothetical protein KDN22_18595 [Verrucomicrobiae bacterium]|nr:hypothetical protein [Verrucomicrobiae bacterium]
MMPSRSVASMIHHSRSLVLVAAGLTLLMTVGKSTAVPPRILSFTVDSDKLPLDGRPWLSWQTVGAETVALSPGIGDVTSFTNSDGAGNGVPPAPISRYRFVDLNEDWLYLDDGEDLSGEVWQGANFNDNGWLIGPAPLGYGDPNATALEFGPDSASKFVTYYFRKEFEASQARIDETEILYLELQRDDGAIVYLNGVEIVRDNLPEGETDGSTTTTFATAGDAETQVFRYIVDKSLLKPGSNILSAEVHQASAASSDLIFDAGLYSVRSTVPVSVVELNSAWRYLDDGSDQTGNGWNETGFDDTGWQEGNGEFGYDSTVEATILDFGSDPDNKHITYYFRRKFLIGDVASVGGLFASLLYDDGAIIYINGVEAARVNLPDDEAITADTVALSASIEGVYEELDLEDAVGFLQNGENTIAVEVHQADPASSDVSFDLDLFSSDANGADTEVVSRHALWKYDDTGVDRGDSEQDPDVAWFGPAFDDSDWSAGPAELGYGDSDGTTSFPTTISFGPDPEDKYITTYFRKQFAIDADTLASLDSLTLSLQRDDGAIVYLNGKEIVRDNLDEGEVDAYTLALSGSADITTWTISKDDVAPGLNTIAVEVHQQDPASSDIYFDLRLTGVLVANSITYTLTVTNADGSASQDIVVDYLPVIEGAPFPAEPTFLTSSQPTGADWDYAAMWSDRQPPAAGKDYIVYGNFASTVRSPLDVADPDFGGNLTLSGSRSRLILGHADGTTARIPLLTIQGGGIWHSLSNAYLQLGTSGSIISVDGSASFNHASTSGDRVLAVGSDLIGSGTITVNGPTTIDGSTATLFLGDGSAFTGDWIILDTVGAAGRNALGSGNITISGTGALDFDYDYFNANATLTLNGSTSQLVIDQTISVGELKVRGLDLPEGVYEGVAIEALGQNFVDRGGSLVIGGTNPDSDDDGLSDSWEQQYFGSLSESGAGDFDGDGDSNAREEITGTDPTDRASAFRLTINATDASVRLAWPGLSSRTYLIQTSKDLITWNVVALTPGANGITTFEDTFNFPPASGAPPLYYRVVVSGS